MRITVTFAGSGDTGIPDGSVLVFEDASDVRVSTPRDVERVGCAAFGCQGCTAMHWRFTGTARLQLEASGPLEGAPLWTIPQGREQDDVTAWRRANPALGVTVSEAAIRSAMFTPAVT